MAQAATIHVGSKVRVLRVRDRIPADLVEALKSDPTGIVTGFRTVDGQGVGVVVDLGAGRSAWFFDDEVTLA
ncbi:cytochrome b6f subunit family protein [Cyanobium sp. NIES-981]|uniref:cytochrome b6f subunit PetP n=1 Tax=Cyanobium sp. NIES-981 TaxID=1851505 RepID=UPI0007DD8A74|nr:cytochrome b6f subunit family protein [Cyanobium sp. NIES-981]SBO43191.1 conserved protein of unknown function [Cyanobium sp. NIES-981]